MRVLVTGVSGMLAPFVIRTLPGRQEVALMSRRPPHPDFAAFPWGQGDITMFAACQRAVQGVTAIHHLAAQPWPVDHPQLRGRAAAQDLPFDATFQSKRIGCEFSRAQKRLAVAMVKGKRFIRASCGQKNA